MDLILWCHAEAAEDGFEDDLERPPTSRGERQAARMAAWLNHRLPATARVLASPALRTQQTAQALDRRFKTVDAPAPSCSVAAPWWLRSRERDGEGQTVLVAVLGPEQL
jgi:phosphohistidine phosphatase